MTSNEAQDQATVQAAHWLVALEDEPDNAELRARFNAWLAANPANAAAWADTSAVYSMMEKTTPVHAGRWTGRPASGDSGSLLLPLRTARRRRVAGVAVALAACLAFFFVPGLVLRLQADHVTATAEQRAVGLEDDSVVRLGPDSAIEVFYDSRDRRVRLLKGEAFFEVTPDARRPFRVVARTVETTVLGTVFNVRLGNDDTEVAVRSGLVDVTDTSVTPAFAERLQPGAWVQVSRDGRVDRGVVPPEEVAPWLGGQMIARDRRMAEVVAELRRYFDGAIVVADAGLGRRRVTGVYNLADPVAALRAVVGSHGGIVLQVSPWLVVVYGD